MRSLAWDKRGAWNPTKQKFETVKDFTSFNDLQAMMQYYAAVRDKCCYEILRETAPIAVCFDIECEFEEPRHETVRVREGLSRDPTEFLQHIRARVEAALPKLARAAPPLVSASHRTGAKISFHLKYESLYLRDMNDRDAFKRDVMEKLGTLIPLIDVSVWAKRKNMRLCWSHKLGDPSRPLVPVGHEAAWSPHAIDEVERHMWTVVPPEATSFYDEPPWTEAAGAAPSRKRNSPAAGEPDTPDAPAPQVQAQTQPKRAKTMSAERFCLQTGKTYDEFIEFMVALPGAGGCGDPRVHGSDGGEVSSDIYWYLREKHTCCHGKTHEEDNFVTHLQTDGLVLRQCLAGDCINKAGKFDLRIIGSFGSGWTTERWCSSEQPPVSELQPWPLPRHWYFYEPLVRRKLGADVRCLASKAERRFDIGANDQDSVFHKFIVEYTNRNGHTTRAELGVSMHNCKLYHTLGPKTFEPALIWSYSVEHDRRAVYEHERMEWWFATTWKHELAHVLTARRRKPDTREPPFSWHIAGMKVWYPWLRMAQLDKLVNGKHSSVYKM
jgi:hypothetical protein